MGNRKNPSQISKQPKPTVQQTKAARLTHSWRARLRGYKKEIAIRQGETIVPMAASILLMMTLSFALETGSVVKYTVRSGFEGMMTVYKSVSLTNSKSFGCLAAARRNATKEENDNQDFLHHTPFYARTVVPRNSNKKFIRQCSRTFEWKVLVVRRIFFVVRILHQSSVTIALYFRGSQI